MCFAIALVRLGEVRDSENHFCCVFGGHWIKFQAPSRIAVLAKEMRFEFLELLKSKIEKPLYDINSELFEAVTKLIMSDGIL